MFFIVLLLLLITSFGRAMEIQEIESAKIPSFRDEVHEKFLVAVAMHQYQKVAFYLQEKLVDIDRQDRSNDHNALQLAAAHDDITMINLLLKFKANIDSPNNKGGNTPLIYATWHGKLATIEYLLELGAKVDIQNALGHTAIHYAISFKDADKVALLVAYRASVTIANSKNITPLGYPKDLREQYWYKDEAGAKIVRLIKEAAESSLN